jgi:hypothetical protein
LNVKKQLLPKVFCETRIILFTFFDSWIITLSTNRLPQALWLRTIVQSPIIQRKGLANSLVTVALALPSAASAFTTSTRQGDYSTVLPTLLREALAIYRISR